MPSRRVGIRWAHNALATGSVRGQDQPRTIGEVLALPRDQYRLYTAVHEISQAAASLAAGKRFVDSCEKRQNAFIALWLVKLRLPERVKYSAARWRTGGVRLHNLTARFISTALSVFLDELAHRARHIEPAGEPRRNISHRVRGYASLPDSLSA
ncbi:hypothetical protein, partial [Streptomyces sp. NPDC000133]|uniref:hypothetical protein n=1 Tax=Streptomyces sp. NPDC000133 TaxID=3364535 RepID=UPI0036AEEA06